MRRSILTTGIGLLLLTGGLYGLVRYPLYTGIFLVLFGQLIHWPKPFSWRS